MVLAFFLRNLRVVPTPARQMIERDADTVGQVVSLELGVGSRPIVRE